MSGSAKSRDGSSIAAIDSGFKTMGATERKTGYRYHDDLSLALHREAVRLMSEDPSLVEDAQATLEW